MDIRDHSSRHEAALADLFAAWGITDDYRNLPEASKCALLERELSDPRPIIPRMVDQFEPNTREVIETFLAIRDQCREGDPASLGTYVISATESPSDVLEVLLLMKESDLAGPGGVNARIPIAPLFESLTSLSGSAEIMATLARIAALSECDQRPGATGKR